MADATPLKRPVVRVARLDFSGGEEIPVGAGEIVVFVGPNNGGKTSALRAIEETCGYAIVPNRILQASTLKPEPRELADYLIATDALVAGHPELRRSPSNHQYSADPMTLCMGSAALTTKETWAGVRTHFLNFCGCRDRHQRLEPVSTYDPMEGQQATQPLQKLARDPAHIDAISRVVRRTFGRDFYLYTAGSKIHPFLGTKPNEEILRSLRASDAQAVSDSGEAAAKEGDGIVNFVALLVEVHANQAPIMLVDQPEAYLHPPQARLLGRALAEAAPTDHQLFIATHSLDVLLGLLDVAPDRLHIVRLTRDEKGNHGRELPPDRLKETWKSPLARHTRVLDALFHERAVIGEADGDCDFFRVMADVLNGTLPPDERRPDVHFVPAWGNARLGELVALIRPLGVPVAVAPDFDTLRDRTIFRNLVIAAGGEWSHFETDYDAVVKAIGALTPPAQTAEAVRVAVKQLADQVTSVPVARPLRKRIEQALKPPAAWDDAKERGASVLAGNPAAGNLDSLLRNLRTLGVELNPQGEMESFARKGAKHGPTWVAIIVESMDLAQDPTLEAARVYVRRLLGFTDLPAAPVPVPQSQTADTAQSDSR